MPLKKHETEEKWYDTILVQSACMPCPGTRARGCCHVCLCWEPKQREPVIQLFDLHTINSFITEGVKVAMSRADTNGMSLNELKTHIAASAPPDF